MVFETRQESSASLCKDVDFSLSKVTSQDIDEYTKLQKPFQDGGCAGFLPDCAVVDFDKKFIGIKNPMDKYFPISIDERPSYGIDGGIGIPDVFRKNSYFDLTTRVNETAQSEALAHLSPCERKQYEAEKSAMEAYERRQMMLMSLIGSDEPPPHTPTLDKVHMQTRQIEQQARDHVLAHMTPTEQAQLKEEERQYYENMNSDWNKLDRMMLYIHHPQPGPMMKEVEQRTVGAIRSHAYRDQPAKPVVMPSYLEISPWYQLADTSY